MSRLARLLVPLALVAAMALALPAAASAARRYHVRDGFAYVTVRSLPGGSYVIGNLYRTADSGPNAHGNYFDLLTRDGLWGYGQIGGGTGNFGGWGGGSCGWVYMPQLKRTRKTLHPPGCPPASALEPSRIFASGSYYRGCSDAGTRNGCAGWEAVTTACPDAHVYGNYNPATHKFANKYGTEPAGRGTTGHGHREVTSGYSGFGLRYRTVDGGAVLVKDTRSPAAGGFNMPKWFFIRAACVMRF